MARRLKNVKIHPLFFAMLVFSVFFGDFVLILQFVFVVCLHEFSHAFVAKKLGYTLNKIVLMPYGVSLGLKQQFSSPNDEIKVALAGPMINFILAFFTIAFWWIAPITFVLTSNFVFVNLVIGLFNLIPAYPLDGGRVLTALINKTKSRAFAIKITTTLNIVFSFLLLGCFVVSLFTGTTNLSFAVMSIFLFLGIFDGKWSGEYGFVPFEPKTIGLKKGMPLNNHVFSSRTQIYRVVSKMSYSKYNLFYILFDNGDLKALNEKQLERLALNFSPTITLKEALQQKVLKIK